MDDSPLGRARAAADDTTAPPLLQVVLENTRALMVVMEHSGRIRRFNRAAQRLSGYTESEVIGRTVWDLLVPESEVAAVRDAIGSRMTRDCPDSLCYHWQTRHGTLREIQWTHTRVRDADGEPALLATGLELREQAAAGCGSNQVICEAQRGMDNLPTLIAHLDAEFRILFINRAVTAWFGRTAGTAVGRACREIAGVEAFGLLEPALRRAFEGEELEFKGRIVDRGGRTRHVRGACAPRQLVAGAGGEVFVLLHDQTRGRFLRRSLMESAGRHYRELADVNRVAALGDLASDIAHEVKQPLTAMVSTAQACVHLIEADETSIQELLEPLERIASQGRRAGDIVTRFRDLVRGQDGEKREPHALAGIVDIVLDLMDAELRRHGVKVTREFPEALPALEVNRVEIEQVLIHLIQNAVEAMETVEAGRRRIRISAETDADGRQVRLRVADGGPGIPPERICDVFTAFYTTKARRFGQGLSISRAIVEAHDGTIQATSLPAGGAEFTIELPLNGPASNAGN